MDSDADSSRASSPDLVVDTSEGGFFSSQYQSFCQERGAAPSRMERGGGKSKSKAQTYHKKEGVQDLRLKVNSRERKRMHDLNQAMDGLREVMPYANGPSVRKLSKISTLLLARNYILMLSNSLEEMKKLVGDVYGGAGKQAPTAHRAPATLPQLALHPLAQSLHALMGATSTSVAPHSPPSAGYLGFRPPVHSLLKDPMHLGGSYGHYHGMLCPCSLCQPLSATVPSLHTVSGFSVGK